MPPDQNQQNSRRPHYHRGRRGHDRRGPDRRPPSQPTESTPREHIDIEQLMRDIRARVSDRTGVELTNQQIQELAARRLEAILDPRAIKPSLLDELRRASGIRVSTTAEERPAQPALAEAALYDSPSGLVRFLRRLLNPLLRLLVDPDAIVRGFAAQADQLRDAAASHREQLQRQTEWNALHFEILRRLVLDVARTDIDAQSLAQRVESLSAKVDFNDRRVRTFEQTTLPPKPPGRPAESSVSTSPATQPRDEAVPHAHGPSEGSGESGRRRRRRRRGRRPGGGVPVHEGPPGGIGTEASAPSPDVDANEEAEDVAEHAGTDADDSHVETVATVEAPPEPPPTIDSGSTPALVSTPPEPPRPAAPEPDRNTADEDPSRSGG